MQFIIRYHFVILFVVIELFSIFLAVQYNHYQRSCFLNSSSRISGVVYENFSEITDYFNLKQTNKELAEQNRRLLLQTKSVYKSNKVDLLKILDTICQQQYDIIPVKIINNSFNKQDNYLTINFGSKVGIKSEMAVIGPNGIVGIVRNVSKNFSTVIPIINGNLRISGKLKKNNYFGSVHWNGTDYRYVVLKEIPNHVSINVGDTVITSGFSSIFPEGILIGTVAKVDAKRSSNFHEVSVLLTEDFKSLSYVYVIDNWMKIEQKELEQQ